MYKNQKKMQVLEIEKGIVLPRLFLKKEPMWGAGGVCDDKDQFVEFSGYDGGWAKYGEKYEWDKEEYIDEEVVYFGLFFKHWGHFLVDLIGRAWYLPKMKKNMKVVLIGEEEPTGNYLEFFELLGVTSDQLLHITEPTRFKKVIIPEVSCRPCIWYTEEFLSTFSYMIEKITEERYVPTERRDFDRVYFTRINFEKAVRSEFSEALIVRWMKANDYMLVCPEQLTLRDQIFIWNHAEKIVCLNGSIPLNILFSENENLQLMVMNKTSFAHKNLDLFLLMRECKVTFLDAYREPLKGYPKSLGAGPFLLGITEDIQEYSKREKMRFPFSEKEIKKDWCSNFCRLVWYIIDIKGRSRKMLSKMLPDVMKMKIRNIRK